MRTVVLPGGKRVPALGQGTWGMGESESVRAREVAALRLGIELGMSLIDSAEMYGDDGTEDLPFTTGSDFLPGVYRSFSTCQDAAEEAALSRIYGGIHFRSASEDGLQAGSSIGEWTVTHYLLPKGNRSR